MDEYCYWLLVMIDLTLGCWLADKAGKVGTSLSPSLPLPLSSLLFFFNKKTNRVFDEE